MTVRLAKINEAIAIASIHKKEIKKGFLSSLPAPFLSMLYKAVIKSGVCIVAQEKDEVVGFIAGTKSVGALYRYFILHYFPAAFFVLLPKMVNFATVRKVWENLWYPKKEGDSYPAELLTIAVKEEFQGKGFAQQMLPMFISEMRNRGVSVFKVMVGNELSNARKFYEKAGFKLQKETEVHKGSISSIYLYEIQ